MVLAAAAPLSSAMMTTVMPSDCETATQCAVDAVDALRPERPCW